MPEIEKAFFRRRQMPPLEVVSKIPLRSTSDGSVPVRNLGIDAARFYAFLAVVVLHVGYQKSMPPSFEGLVDHMMRWAVPVYFMISGYLFQVGSRPLAQRWWRMALRLGQVFLFWQVIYLLLASVMFGPVFSDKVPIAFLVDTVIYGGVAWHLWFLPTLGLCLTVFVITSRLGWATTFWVALLFFLAGLVLNAYAPVLGGKVWPTRNGPFFGLIFFVVGAWLSHRKVAVPLAMAIALFLGGVCIQLSEALLLSQSFGAPFGPYDFLFGTLPMGVGAFLLLTALPVSPLAARLGRYALGMYCSHVLWMWVASGPLAIPSGTQADVSDLILTYVFVVASSIFTTYALSRLTLTRRFVA